MKKGLNEAVSGTKANDIPIQADRLIRKMRSLRGVDFKNDWKMITLFIGGNDLCQFCNSQDPNKYSPESYIDNIRIGLDMIYK